MTSISSQTPEQFQQETARLMALVGQQKQKERQEEKDKPSGLGLF